MDKQTVRQVFSQTLNPDGVFGKPETVGERVIVPVMEMVCAAGEYRNATDDPGSTMTSQAANYGGGMRGRPLACIEVSAAGVQVQSIVDTQVVVLAGVALLAWTLGWIGLIARALTKE